MSEINGEAMIGSGISPERFQKAAETVLSWKRPLLVTHINPDGDGLGCVISMNEILRGRGLDPVGVLFEECRGRYAGMNGIGDLRVIENDSDPILGEVDGVLVMDTCSYTQLSPIADWLKRAELPKVVVDHHVTRDDLADEYLVDVKAGGASLILYQWAKAVGWDISKSMAEALYVGIATDTGWFRFSNTCSAAMRAAGDLIDCGVDVDKTYSSLYLNDEPARMRFLAAAMSGLELLCDDTVAVMSVTGDMLRAANAGNADSEGIVNTPMSVGAVEVSIMLLEQDDGIIKCSMRSKGVVDVAALAGRFGGGGHARAAGVRIPGDIAEVKNLLVKAIGELK